MSACAPALSSVAPAQKTISFPGALSEDIVQTFRRVRVGTGGNLRYACALDGSVDTIPNVQSGETLPIAGTRIFAAGTTAQDITVGA
jgi:hypothetical protein